MCVSLRGAHPHSLVQRTHARSHTLLPAIKQLFHKQKQKVERERFHRRAQKKKKERKKKKEKRNERKKKERK